MNIEDFELNREKFGIEGSGIKSITKLERSFKSKSSNETFVFPSGTHVHVFFSPKKYPSVIFVKINDKIIKSNSINASKWLTGISNPPSLKTLEKWSFDGISKSMTKKSVEPDGYGPDGSPSWLLVVGVI